MCGIVAAMCPRSDLVFHLIKGLKNMQYRGYDSWGVMVDTDKEPHKEVGQDIKMIYPEGFSDSVCGIGHTRWATHGEVNHENTHPVTWDGKIYVVHNGTVSDFESWQDTVENQFKRRPKTDTEVLAALISEFYFNHEGKALVGIRGCLQATASILGADFGSIVVMIPEEKLIAGISCGSPLLVAQTAAGEVFAASQEEGLPRTIPNFTRLGDRGTFIAYEGMCAIEAATRGCKRVDDVFNTNKDPDRSCMIQEIEEQVELPKRVNELPTLLDTRYLKKIVGCGSSHYVGMLASRWMHELGHDSHTVYGAEVDYINQDTLLISQSGETKDLIKNVPKHANCGLLTNSPNSTLATMDGVAQAHYMGAGREEGVAATKTFMASALYLYKSINGKVPLGFRDMIQNVLDRRLQIQQLAKKVAGYRNILFLGTGTHYPIALEAALKMKEIAYIHAEGMPAAEVKHGPIALIDDDTLSIFLFGSDERNKVLDNIHQIKSRNGEIMCLSNTSESDLILPSSGLTKLQCLVTLVAVQLLSYYVTLEKGLSPDRPRNLAKTSTV